MELIVDIKKKLMEFNLEVSFKANNSILGILGESGSGKSMTLRCIAGLIKPDEGRIILNGRTLFDSEKNINLPIKDRKIGFLFQNYALFPHMTVEKNIGYALSSYVKEKKKEIVDEMLNMMQIESLRNRYPHEISGGQQQRVALARALAINPEALLLDEPFSALDNHLRNIMIKQMRDTLSTYKGTTLFVTHNMEEAYELCENLLIISCGKNVGNSNKKVIFENPPTVAAARLTGCKNISPFKEISSGLVEVKNWGCRIKVSEKISKEMNYVGIRAHYIKLAKEEENNTFSTWPVYISETPFRKIIYLKLIEKPSNTTDFHLIWDISSEEWDIIKDKPLPWRIYLDEGKMIFINEKK